MQDNLSLKYGQEDLPLDLTGFLKVKVFAPRRPDHTVDVDSALALALKNPMGAASLQDLAREASAAVVVIPDRTRPRIAKRLLPMIVDELARAGLSDDRISIFVATGTHGLHTDREMRDLVGETIGGRFRIHQNASRQKANYVKVGKTARGTQVLIDKRVAGAGLVVVVGSVAAHYFAGWSGGRKMIVPGASYVDTAWANHKLTLIPDGTMNPRCGSGIMEGNPVHEDMVEAVGFMKNLFAVNVVLDGWAEIADLTAGHIIDSHLEAARRARGLLEMPVGEKCDLAIVSAGGYPLDIDFIQSHKSIDHAAECLKPGGVMIAVMECSNGTGSDTFLPWFETCDTKAICTKLLENYELNGHTALSLMKKLERMSILFVSSLPEDIVDRMGMTPAVSLSEAVGKAKAIVGDGALTYVLPCAWGILPIV
jgi:nickel-dependent lactate racemase